MHDVRAVDELLSCQSESFVARGRRPSDGHFNDVISDADNGGPKLLGPVSEKSSVLLCIRDFIPTPDPEEAWDRPGLSGRNNG